MFRNLKDRIEVMNRVNRIHPVLVIDEAHLLRNEILQEIRMLSNFDIDSFNALTILLAGQEPLVRKFSLPILECLANSITISVFVDNLSEAETTTYVEQRLRQAGMQGPLFTKAALKLLHQSSGGVLRAVNTIALASMARA
jgi:type II secretory pathway predicted ATPase ExeA